MNFQFITSLVKQIISAIENSAVSAVRVLSKNTFSVKVANQIKKIEVRGQVVVANQKNLEKLLRDQTKVVKSVETSVNKEAKLERKVIVRNFPQELDLTPLKKGNSEIVNELKNVDSQVQSLHKPLEALKKIEVSNQPTEQLDKIAGEATKLIKAVKALKLDPKINVQASKPERIIVPAPQVNVEKSEVDYKKIALAISESVDGVDYNKLAKILDDSIGSIQISGGGGGKSYAFQMADGTKAQAIVNSSGYLVIEEYESQDIDDYTDESITYIGEATRSGNWRITRIILTTNTFRYAHGLSDYAANFANRENLEYDYIYA